MTMEAYKVMECGVHENVETKIYETKKGTRKEVAARWWSRELAMIGSETIMMREKKRCNKVGNAIHMENGLQYS